MARDIARIGKTGLPVVIKVPAGLTTERTDDSTSPVVIDLKAEVEWSISFNPRELEDYRYAVRQLRLAVLLHHGPDTLRRLLAEETPSTKRALQAARNDRLLAAYLRSGLSIRKCAAKLADKNKSLPRDYRYGPTGSTNAETLEKQIGRQMKAMKRNPLRRKYIERLASELAQWGADIS
jgi:hypothetical protein